MMTNTDNIHPHFDHLGGLIIRMVEKFSRSKKTSAALLYHFMEGYNLTVAASRAGISRQAAHLSFQRFVNYVKKNESYMYYIRAYDASWHRKSYIGNPTVRLLKAVRDEQWHRLSSVYIRADHLEEFTHAFQIIRKRLSQVSIVPIDDGIDPEVMAYHISTTPLQRDAIVYDNHPEIGTYICALRGYDLKILHKMLFVSDGSITLQTAYQGYLKFHKHHHPQTTPMSSNEWFCFCKHAAALNTHLQFDDHIIRQTDALSQQPLSTSELVMYNTFISSQQNELPSRFLSDKIVEAGLSQVSARKVMLESPILVQIKKGLYRLNRDTPAEAAQTKSN